MPSTEMLRHFFPYGYDSGNIETWLPSRLRFREERKIGGSYRRVLRKGIAEFLTPSSRVLELGPGKGSWSRAILNLIPKGELHTVDFHDVTKWVNPADYGGRLHCHLFDENKFEMLPDNYFDFFWSFGVLCHNETSAIRTVMMNARPKMKPGGLAVHQYSDWKKLDAYGWERGGVPTDFKTKPDSEIWWPRNDQATMMEIARDTGWKVINPDIGLVARDSMILLCNE